MRVLLTEGSGLTSRQCATVLSAAGHQVEVLSSDPLCLCRWTRHVRRVHRVPAFGTDPHGWLGAALEVYAGGGFDVLLPTQEQVAVLSAVLSSAPERLRSAGVVTAVPPFEALARVQDKAAAARTLHALGLPQPAWEVTSAGDWGGAFPVYAKLPVATASTGVRLVGSAAELRGLAAEWPGDLLLQVPVEGPLAMVQSVFASGELVAFHACERAGIGVGGGAAHKRGLALPSVREDLARLGRELGWHGALSADVILGPSGPVLIDLNPRIVEPVNALRSGVDLVGALLAAARGGSVRVEPEGVPGVRTHQLMLALLGAAERGGRRAVLAELPAAALRRGPYRGSAEELTPGLDPKSVLLLAAVGAATLARPASWSWFASGSVTAYALTPTAWRDLLTLTGS